MKRIIGYLVYLVTEETALWFVCLAEQGTNVIATKPLLQYKEQKLVFEDKLQFINLRRNFFIILEVYCLRLRKKSLPHDEKYHLNDEEVILMYS